MINNQLSFEIVGENIVLNISKEYLKKIIESKKYVIVNNEEMFLEWYKNKIEYFVGADWINRKLHEIADFENYNDEEWANLTNYEEDYNAEEYIGYDA